MRLNTTTPKIEFGIDKSLITRVEFETGEVINIESDGFAETEYYANQHHNALKLNFLSPLFGSTEFIFEKSIKPGRSWEVALGLIGLGFDPFDANPAGLYGKFAYKFMRTPDFYTQRMHYSHILKGGYFAPEFAIRHTRFEDYTNYYDTSSKSIEDFSVAFTLKLGKQWVFDDNFIVDLYIGGGYGWQSQEIVVPYAFIVGTDRFPIAFTSGLRIGWTL